MMTEGLRTMGVAAVAAVAASAILRAADSPDPNLAPGVVQVTWSEDKGEVWTVKGLADRESGRPMTRDTIFSICSNSKPVASVFVLTFVEEGLFSLDDPVSKYLPEFADIKIKGRPPKRQITLRYLITHLSGLPFSVSDSGRLPDAIPYQEQVKLAVKQGLRNEPGESYRYCNLGFQVMGAIIEKLTGRRVPDLMKERIFDPLGMTETTFYPTAEMLARLATPYYYPPNGGKPVRYEMDNLRTPPFDNTNRTAVLSSGIFCTAGDYLKFSQMIARKGVGVNGKRILSERMFDEYLLKRQTPPGDKVNSSFDIAFNADHTGGGKGGLLATYSTWNWGKRSCYVSFKAKSPYPPKGMKSKIDASGFGGKKTSFIVSEVKVADGEASCRVSNNEDRHGVAVVKLLVDGKEAASSCVELAIGESKTVKFKHEAKQGEKIEFSAVSR